MCFRFASCIGVHVRDDHDFYGPTSASKVMPPPPRHAADSAATTKTPAPAPRYDRNADEAGRRTRPSPAGAGEQQAHAYTAAADEALEPPAAARNDEVVAHGACNNGAHHHQYRCYEHEQPARKEGADGCYTTATAASDHERY